MASCNAIFWDPRKRSGTAPRISCSAPGGGLQRSLEKQHVPLLSASSLTTAALTLRDAYASFTIFPRANPKSTYRFGQGLSYVFIPLGCLGLMRLPAALWLSDDYEYSNVLETTNCGGGNADSPTVTREGPGEPLVDLDPHTSKCTNATVTRTSTNVPPSSEPAIFTSPPRPPHPYSPCPPLPHLVGPVHNWPPKWLGRLYLSHAKNYLRSSPYVSLPHLMLNLMYFIITTMGILITNTYMLPGRTQSMLIPCIHTTCSPSYWRW